MIARVPAVPDLAAVLSAWPNLPEPVKAGILAMVELQQAGDGSLVQSQWGQWIA